MNDIPEPCLLRPGRPLFPPSPKMLGTSDFSALIGTLAATTGPGRIEVEARFRSFTRRGVTQGAFNRLRRYLGASGKEVVEDSIDQAQRRNGPILSSIRKTTVAGKPPVFMVKTRIWTSEDTSYAMRVALSTETLVDTPIAFVPTSERHKRRYSYLLAGGFRADLTSVTGGRSQEDDWDAAFEVEVEAIDPMILLNPEGQTRFQAVLREIFLHLHDSVLPYTRDDYNLVVNHVRRMLSGATQGDTPTDEMGFFMVYQPRNLHLDDMVTGGLIPGFGPAISRYTVTHKTDGVRKILLFHPSGIWFVMAPDELNLVARPAAEILTGDDDFVTGMVKKHSGTMLEGELVPPSSRRGDEKRNILLWFKAFDCLATGVGEEGALGSTGVMAKDHWVRMSYAEKVANDFKDWERLVVDTKTFWPVPGHGLVRTAGFESPEQFYSVMRELQGQLSTLPYNQDGYIFTPTGPLYPNRSDIGKDAEKRVLTRLVDICKWKRVEELTIDFAIYHAKGGVRLYAGGRKEQTVVFAGSDEFPFANEVVEVYTRRIDDVETTIDTRDLPDGTVVEYFWNRDHLAPVRVRTDRPRPNRIEAAIDTWKLAHNPILLDTLVGRDFTLLRRYHNQIKWSLYNGGVKSQQGPTLLDIGSGQGQDVLKWGRFARIVAVEPNPQNIEELVRRARQRYRGRNVRVATTTEEATRMGREAAEAGDNILVLRTGGENYAMITAGVRAFIGRAVTTISLMLSLSFFWRDRSLVDGLARTIGENAGAGTRLLYLTIDGDLVEEMFDPVFNRGPAIRDIDRPLGERARIFYRRETRSLLTTLMGTFVTEQEEWLVHLDDLAMRLVPFGIIARDRHRADKENFLDPEGLVLSRMYTYGIWIFRTGGAIPITRAEEVEAITPKEEAAPRMRPNLPPLPPLVRPNQGRLPVTGVGLPPRPMPPGRVSPVRRRLPPLPVYYDPGSPNARGDDYREILAITWFTKDPVARIATIGDGSSFFHAYLKAWYAPYANERSYFFRRDLVRDLRRDLAYLLYQIDPRTGEQGRTYYDTAAKGTIAALGTSSRPAVQTNVGVRDLSREGLWRTLNTNVPVSGEVMRYVVDTISTNADGTPNRGVDVAMVQAMSNDVEPLNQTGDKREKPVPLVFLVDHGARYEVLGVVRPEGVQTLFFPQDDFYRAYKAQRMLAVVSSALDDVRAQVRRLSALFSPEERERLLAGKAAPPGELERVTLARADAEEATNAEEALRAMLEQARTHAQEAGRGEWFDEAAFRELVEDATAARDAVLAITRRYT